MGKPASLSPARLSELTRLAADIVRSVDEDQVMPLNLANYSVRKFGRMFLASDVESLLLELAQVIAALNERLAIVSTARNTACELAESATFVIDNGLCLSCRDSIDNIEVEQIDRLRKAGTP